MAGYISPIAAVALALIAFVVLFEHRLAVKKSSIIQRANAELKAWKSSSTSTTSASPVVLVGLNEGVCKRVSAHLMPEFEVILGLYSTSRARTELLSMKAGQKPCFEGDIVGTHNFSQPPKHVIFSKGYREKKMQEVRDALGGPDSGICWYWTPTREGEHLPNPKKIDQQQAEDLAKMIGEQIKGIMVGVVDGGNEGRDGLYEL